MKISFQTFTGVFVLLLLTLSGCGTTKMVSAIGSGTDYVIVYQDSDVIVKHKYDEEFTGGLTEALWGAGSYDVKRQHYFKVIPLTTYAKSKKVVINSLYKCGSFLGNRRNEVRVSDFSNSEVKGLLLRKECGHKPNNIKVSVF